MKSKMIGLLAFVLPWNVVAATAQEPTPAPAVPAGQEPDEFQPPVYNEKADARFFLARALMRAQRDNRRVLIQWGANWCGWCKWLARTMQSDPKLHHKLLYEYEVVHFDVGQFDKNKDLAKQLGAEFKAIPFLAILDADGQPLVQQNTEPFETKVDGKGGHDPAKLLEFLTRYQAPPLAAAEVRTAALARARMEEKRVFLYFGAPASEAGEQLEGWLQEPAAHELLDKGFVFCKLDTERMTGGKAVYEAELAAAGAKATCLPWIAFLDADGKQLAAGVNANGEAVGFPFPRDQLALFTTMLGKARTRLTEAEAAELVESLNQYEEALEVHQRYLEAFEEQLRQEEEKLQQERARMRQELEKAEKRLEAAKKRGQGH